MKAFHETHPAIAIAGSLQPEDDAYYSKLIAMVAGGTPPDLAYIHPNSLAGFAAKKLITPVDPFAAQDKTVDIADFYQTTLSYFDFGGKHYGLPYYSGPTVTYFNKSLFQKYGVKTPDQYAQEGNWTWQTLLDVAQKLTQGTDPATKTYGYQGIGLSLGTYNAPIWENGGEVWDDGMTKMLLDQPQAADALQFQADLSAKYNVVGGSFVPGTAAMNHELRHPRSGTGFQERSLRPWHGAVTVWRQGAGLPERAERLLPLSGSKAAAGGLHLCELGDAVGGADDRLRAQAVRAHPAIDRQIRGV